MELTSVTSSEQILASWSSLDDVTIIRNVVSQGKENIELCIDYCSQRYQVTPHVYRKHFHNIVRDYVLELLQIDHLIQRAAEVLHNVGRNVPIFFYQFSKQCDDERLRTIVLNYSAKEYSDIYSQLITSLQFHWDVMEQLKQTEMVSGILTETTFLENNSLEDFMAMDMESKMPLIIELYLAKGDDRLLEYIDKFSLWKHLITSKRISELTRWCWQSLLSNDDLNTEITALNSNENHIYSYQLWPIDSEMYQYGVQQLHNVYNDAIRNCFAAAGYLFPEEKIDQQLQRISMTNSFQKNIKNLSKRNLGYHILSSKNYHLLLKDFVSIEQLVQMAQKIPEEKFKLELITYLKKYSLYTLDGFQMIVKKIAAYLNCGKQLPFLVTFFNFLMNEKMADIKFSVMTVFKIFHFLKYSPSSQFYIDKLISNVESDLTTLPTPYQLLQTFKGFNMKLLKKSKWSLVNSQMSQESAAISDSYEQIKNLYYLKQYRSCYCVYHVFTELLRHYTQISRHHLQMICENVYDYVYQLINSTTSSKPLDRNLLLHCIVFCEMLGFDTRHIRSLIKLKFYLDKEALDLDSNQLAETSSLNMVEQAEQKLTKSLNLDLNPEEKFPLEEYTAIMTIYRSIWKKRNTYGEEINSKQISLSMLQQYANKNSYWQFLVLIQYFEVPLMEVKKQIKEFKCDALRDHMYRALVTFDTDSFMKKKSSEFKRNKHSTKRVQQSNKYRVKNMLFGNDFTEPTESLSSSHTSSSATEISKLSTDSLASEPIFITQNDGSKDLFALVLKSSTLPTKNPTFTYLLEDFCDINEFMKLVCNTDHTTMHSGNITLNFLCNAIIHKRPILAILPTINLGHSHTFGLTIQYCWLTWLLVTTQHWENALLLIKSNPNEFIFNLIDELIRHNHVQNLLRSFKIFFPRNEIIHLFRFMELTAHHFEFGVPAFNEMHLYCSALIENRVKIPFLTTVYEEYQLINTSINLLLSHLQYNFQGMIDQHKCLACLGKTIWKDITDDIDFCLLEEIHELLLENIGCHNRLDEDNRCLQINFTRLMEPGSEEEFDRLLDAALEAEEYMMAVEIASLIQKPIGILIQQKWLKHFVKLFYNTPEMTLKHFQPIFQMIDECEMDVTLHSLPPSQLINFLLYIRSQIMPEHYTINYLLFKRILELIKQHHLFTNESFDVNEIEYNMFNCYLRIEDKKELKALPLYYSAYYEEIMMSERKVLYKSYQELHDLADIKSTSFKRHYLIDEYQISRLIYLINLLLDMGDIVGALHLQELFNMQTMEMRLIIFCMRLAEGLISWDNMSFDERRVINEIRKFPSISLNKRSLLKSIEHVSEISSFEEFEQILSKEKQDTLDVLKLIASNLKHGQDIAKRILCVYRIATYLDMTYLDILRTKDTHFLVQSLEIENCLQPLVVLNDILISNCINEEEMSEFLAYEITRAIIKPCFYILQQETKISNAMLWGCNIDRGIDFFFEMISNRSKLGFELLKYCDALLNYRRYQNKKPFCKSTYFANIAKIFKQFLTPKQNNAAFEKLPNDEHFSFPIISHKKHNIFYVELLIKAHQCFVHDCCMEGIVDVLNRTKHLNNILAQAKSWSLLVRLLTGIGRYREMSYCFETLIANDQFESLLGQFDEVNSIALQQGILEYLKEHCFSDQAKELFKLAAIHFQMYKDLAEMWHEDANNLLEKIVNDDLKIPKNNEICSIKNDNNLPKLYTNLKVKNDLQQVLDSYVNAAENYLLDQKILFAEKMAAKAELVAMQIDLASNTDTENYSDSIGNCYNICPRVICLKETDKNIFQHLVTYDLNVFQASILSRVYNYTVNWSEALLQRFVLNGNRDYFYEFLQLVDINDNLIENIIRSYQNTYAKQIKHDSQQQSQQFEMKFNYVEEHLSELVEMIKAVSLKYKLSSILGIKSIVLDLLNEQTIHYLRDINFGHMEDDCDKK